MTTYIEMAVPAGKDIPTIENYAAGLLPFEIHEDDSCWVNQYGCVAAEDHDALCVVQTGDSHFSLLPGPEFSPRLYRGQPHFHKSCVPSLFVRWARRYVSIGVSAKARILVLAAAPLGKRAEWLRMTEKTQ